MISSLSRTDLEILVKDLDARCRWLDQKSSLPGQQRSHYVEAFNTDFLTSIPRKDLELEVLFMARFICSCVS